MVRLQKALAAAGCGSRRQCETLITAGRVTVNGTLVTELGVRIDPGRDEVRVDGRAVDVAPPKRYLMLNKPAGYVTTRSDPHNRQTVYSLLGRDGEGLFYVGRLDKDTEGLLLFTNDGVLAYRLTHPKHEVEKVYLARVEGIPSAEDLAQLASGVQLGSTRTAPAHAEVLSTKGGQALVRLRMVEGKKRQIKRMLKAVGHGVVHLRRVQVGPLKLGELAPGAWRNLTEGELTALREQGLLEEGQADGDQ